MSCASFQSSLMAKLTQGQNLSSAPLLPHVDAKRCSRSVLVAQIARSKSLSCGMLKKRRAKAGACVLHAFELIRFEDKWT